MSRLPIAALGTALVLAGFSPARATVLDYNSLTAGLHAITFGDLVVTADAGSGDKKDSKAKFEAFTSSTPTVKVGVGVGAGNAVGTIDGNESIDVLAATAHILNGFTLVFAQSVGSADNSNEVAAVDASGVVRAKLHLTIGKGGPVLTDNSGFAVAGAHVDPLFHIAPNEYRVSGLDIGFTKLTFGPPNNGKSSENNGKSSDDNKFAFVDLTYTAVPEPATIVLLGAGVVGLGLARRRLA